MKSRRRVNSTVIPTKGVSRSSMVYDVFEILRRDSRETTV